MFVSDDDIIKAERIFLKSGQSFDKERKDFIKCIDKSLHLQACPGSGKTTVLLAKLYILSEKMPFEKNQGICVLTHTNVAIDIIKNKLGEKANRIFSHPNFFGTIQSFVDRYLAIPAYIKCFGYRPNYIDTEIQKERMLNTFYLRDIGKDSLNNLKSLNYANKIFGEYTFQKSGQECKIVYSSNKKPINIKKPRSKNDWTDDEKKEIIKAAVQLKCKVLKIDRVLSYFDSYDFANKYLDQIPELSKIFSSRFKYVFIDEAQDTSAIQKEIIEKCFNENVIIQWIGDVNQGIMNDDYTETVWEPKKDNRYEIMKLTKSHRIPQPIADVIKNIAIKPYDTLCGCDNISIKPVIIVFDNNTTDKVLNKFAELVCTKKSNYNDEEKNLYDISLCSGYPAKAVGWVGKENENGLSIKYYFPNFDKKLTNINKIYFPNLYTMYELSKNVSPREFKNRTISCILEALSLSNIMSPKNRKYSKSELINLINETNKNLLNELLTSIAKYYIENDFQDFSNVIINCISSLRFNLKNKAKEYIQKIKLKDAPNTQPTDGYNIYKKSINGTEVIIPIDTVHGIKGETHTATLYLETKYYTNSIEYFYKELTDKKNMEESDSKRKKQALKIAHVAFSRPTHLLCIAIHQEEYEKYCNNFSNDVFTIINLLE
ncbi:MAG TPA: UvrD-helicase domain-containing protein [Candidatus Dojkabacteria bacterium]|nr:UvrD-helicase domain-containing protein [Candidatus Dojkabacteria bacterium]